MKSSAGILLSMVLIFACCVTGLAQEHDAESIKFRKTLTVAKPPKTDLKKAKLFISDDQKSVLVDVYAKPALLWNVDIENKKISEERNVGQGIHLGFVPNSNWLYSSNFFGTVDLLDRSDQSKSKELPHALSEGSVVGPAVSPSGKYMATRSKHKQLQFWNMRTQKPYSPRIYQGKNINAMAFSTDEKLLFSRAGDQLKVWNAETAKLIAGPIKNSGYSIAYDSESKQLATFENNPRAEPILRSKAIIQTISDNKLSVKHRVDMPAHVKYAYWVDSEHLLIVTGDKRGPDVKPPFAYVAGPVVLISLSGMTPTVSEYDGGWVVGVVIDPNGKYFLTRTYRDTTCYEIGQAKPRWVMPTSGPGWKHQIKISSQGWFLARETGGRTMTAPGGVRVKPVATAPAIAYSLSSGKELWRRDDVDVMEIKENKIWIGDAESLEVWETDVSK